MNKANLLDFVVNKDDESINISRPFDAPLDLVWSAWTEADILDQWWAPPSHRAITKSTSFTERGHWHYCIINSEQEKHWALFTYDVIRPREYFSGVDAFCDENAVVDNTRPTVKWEHTFIDKGSQTAVNIRLKFDSLEDLQSILKMGFKEGFAAGIENLDRYIAAQFYLRKQNKPNATARIATYVNFPGNAEEAFNFYRSVFRTEFINGIKRFDELPESPDQPAVSEQVKKMVLHVELPLLGGHILMGTDAPKEMGMTVSKGNNMYIQVEPEFKEEATRIFNQLSAGGIVDMPIQDMFWGAYFGSFTDKFGINWMVNYQSL